MVLISLTKGLSKNKHTCKAEVGYMNRLPLIAGYPPTTTNMTITSMLTETCYPHSI